MKEITKNPKAKGRRTKMIIQKIEHPVKRQVAFSKRKSGIFSKASQLCTLSGANLAILIFSPLGSKVFKFGNPNADAVIDQYLSGGHDSLSLISADHEDDKNHYTEALKKLAIEKQKKTAFEYELMMKKINGQDCDKFWWDEDVQGIEKMDGEDLGDYVICLEELRENLVTRIHELSDENKNYDVADHAPASMSANVNNYSTPNTSSFSGLMPYVNDSYVADLSSTTSMLGFDLDLLKGYGPTNEFTC